MDNTLINLRLQIDTLKVVIAKLGVDLDNAPVNRKSCVAAEIARLHARLYGLEATELKELESQWSQEAYQLNQ